MEYFKLLNLEKEPFSNSPDPDYFFKSRQHTECLQNLELSLRLRRGLNVVVGEVGTGKTTLCRQMIKKFSRDEEFETHLVLDPHIADPTMFLQVVAQMFEREPNGPTGDWADHKEFIKQYLYERGVKESRVVVLIIDEGQKIPSPILEILRELLNYETNEFKLLQIVVFAQREFEQILEKHANFADRINLLHMLGPLGFRDTRLMIDYRLQKAGAESSLNSMLSFPALAAIYRATGGYPRKIVNLCHRIMLAMIVQNRKKAGWQLVRSCVNRKPPEASGKWQKAVGFLLVIVGVAGFAYTGFTPETKIATSKPKLQKVFPVADKGIPAGLSPADEKVKPSTRPDIASAPVEFSARVASKSGTVPKPEEGEIPVGSIPVFKAAPATEKQIEEVADAAAAVAVVPRRRPLTLGMIRLQARETLSWAMIKVYGEYTNQRRRAIATDNPGLKDLDNLFSGQAIGLPALAYDGLQVPDYLNWIRVGRMETISEALNIIRRYSTRAAPLRVIPFWHKDQGLRFDIIFWTYFSSPDEAARFLVKLPEAMRMKSEIIPGWEKGVIFYANPSPGIGRKIPLALTGPLRSQNSVHQRPHGSLIMTYNYYMRVSFRYV
ncbi:MAG: AAA family ATPase [Desulfobacterales bacterium]|nr:AAA family ATPase [Desulfobacterales bacterium]